MALKAGTNTNFANSMAQDIEQAFFKEWPKVMGDATTPETNPQLKLLFVAVAQGVIRHLVDHPGSFIVKVDGDGDGDVTQITFEGTLYT